MKSMERLKDMLCDELEKMSSKGEITSGSLDTIDKLTHSIKSIATIIAMEDAGYSNYGSYDNGSYDDGSYDYGRNSYRTSPRRDGRGRYSNRGYSRRDYSRDDKEDVVERLEDMMQETSDHEVREALKKALQSMK